MASDTFGPFQPEYAVPPGRTIQDKLNELDMTQAELALRMKRPKKTINELVKGKIALTHDTALELETVLNIPARIWLNLESRYRESLARQRRAEQLLQKSEWLTEVPWLEMDRLGWLGDFGGTAELIDNLLKFFAIATPDAYYDLWTKPQAAYRKSAAFKSNPHALAAWLRRGQIEAEQIDCNRYDAQGFRGALHDIRGMTKEPPEVFEAQLINSCKRHGVAVVFVPEFPGVNASGATQWLRSSKPVIQLSLRFGTSDQLWFSFFHEAAHVLLHNSNEKLTFVDNESWAQSPEEQEANQFAAEALIPSQEYSSFVSAGNLSAPSIMEFARKMGIAPGIVVGRLQHDKRVPFSHYNNLKTRLKWAD